MREEKIINLLRGRFKYKGVIKGIGDDTAVLPFSHDFYLLFTTDTIVDGIHFKLNEVHPQDIGYKGLAVNISDIAAMGGIPLYATVGMGLPKYDLSLVRKIYDGIKELADEYKVKIVGGDTVRSEVLFLSVSMIGKVEKEFLSLRKGARVGDLICVTGKIGGAISSGKHLRFKPRVREARIIVKELSPTSMIDVSDGLLLDLYRLCKESGVGARVYKERVPINEGCSFYEAIKEGEDFELLFTLGRKEERNLAELRKRIGISIIGEITNKRGIYICEGGKIKKVKVQGYDHFV